MKKTMTILIGGILAAVLQAMPTPAALEKARPLIQELMADDFAALKADKKTHEAVGDAAMKLLSNAETEAAKFLLCKAAFGLYIRGKAYDKAADVLATFRESISDLPTADLVELAQRMHVSRPYISKVLKGDVNISFGTAAKLAHALALDFSPELKRQKPTIESDPQTSVSV